MTSTSIHRRFSAHEERFPEAVAVSSGAARLTYRDVNLRANRLAHRLLGLGVRPEEPVAVLMTRSADLVVAILAVLKAGCCYLPLHEAYPLDRQQWIMDDVGGPVLLVDDATAAGPLPVGRAVVVVDAWGAAGEPATDPGVEADADQLAYVMYTSGSTGTPKGVAVTHRGVVGLADDPGWDTGRHDRVLLVAPHAFGVSTYELWVPLLRGGHVVLAPPGELSVDLLRGVIAQHDITALHLTAGLFRVIAEAAPDCLLGVREVLTGGDVISAAAVRRVLDTCPGIVVRAMYGSTEVSSFATGNPMTSMRRLGPTVSVGRPLTGLTPYVLDDLLNPVADGVEGELYLGGSRLARGYHLRADLTAEKFVADPFAADGSRMYRTGDIVRRGADGMIDFLGRASAQVKIRGFRVEPGEIESVLAGHPGVADAAVVAVEATAGEKRLVAYVVPGASSADAATLKAHAAASLPDYMVPAAVVFLDALPLTPNGKLDRAALPEPVATATSDYRAPGTARQEWLCELFADVLGVARVGLDDSFFDLDGQSLLAMRLISRIKSTLGVAMTIGDLFDAPTVADLDLLLTRAA